MPGDKKKRMWYESAVSVAVIGAILASIGSVATTLLPIIFSENDFYVTIDPVRLEPKPLAIPSGLIDKINSFNYAPQQNNLPCTANIKVVDIHEGIFFKSYDCPVFLKVCSMPPNVDVDFFQKSDSSNIPTFSVSMYVTVMNSSESVGDKQITVVATGGDGKVRNCTFLISYYSPEDCINISNRLLAINYTEDAVDWLNKSIELNCNNSAAYYYRGIILCRKLHKLNESINDFDIAIMQNPSWAMPWNEKGTALYYMGMYNEALDAYDKALELNPTLKEAWYNKANALYDLGNFSEACRCFQTAISLDRNYKEAWFGEGNTYLILGDYNESIKAYDSAITIDPQYAEAWYKKGYALLYLDEYNEALNAFDTTIKLKPQLKRALYGKSTVLMKLGKYSEANETLRGHNSFLG